MVNNEFKSSVETLLKVIIEQMEEQYFNEMESRILNRTDTSILNKRELRSVISLLAYEKGDYFFFVFDANINKDFRDDKVYSFLKKDLIKVKNEDWHKYIIRQKMKIEYLFKGNIITLESNASVL